MDAEKIARKIMIDVSCDAKGVYGLRLGALDNMMDNAISKIATALREAYLVGYQSAREQAAGVADEFRCGSCGMDGEAAAAIRKMEPSDA